jgi:hypothetical protein
MTDNTIARIPISLTQQDKDRLDKLKLILETNEERRLSTAAVVRKAIEIALQHS